MDSLFALLLNIIQKPVFLIKELSLFHVVVRGENARREFNVLKKQNQGIEASSLNEHLTTVVHIQSGTCFVKIRDGYLGRVLSQTSHIRTKQPKGKCAKLFKPLKRHQWK